MRPTLLVALLASSLAAGARAQTLAQSIPADVLLYVRGENPLKTLQDAAGSKLLWSNPVDVKGQVLKFMDEGLSHADSFFGFNAGSFSTYLNSVTEIEGALFDLVLTDGAPEIDFVIALKTPQAEQIYDVFSGSLIKRQVAERAGEGELDLSLGDVFNARIARHGDQIVIGSEPDRVHEVMRTFGSVVPGCLAQSEAFKATIDQPGERGTVFLNLGRGLALLSEEMPRRERDEFNPVASPLGFWKLLAAGYRESDAGSRLAVKAQGSIPALDIFAGAGGPPDLLALAPADVTVAGCWPGGLAGLWQKGGGFFLDPAKFPYAAQVEEGIRSFQEFAGIRAEEIAALVDGGLLVGWDPLLEEVDDDDAVFVVLKCSEPARLQEALGKVLRRVTRGEQEAPKVTSEAGVTWLSFEGVAARRNVVCAITDQLVVAALEPLARKVVDGLQEKIPTLGKSGALKGLPARGSAFAYVSLKGIFAQENEFSIGFHGLAPGAGMAGVVQVTPELVTVSTTWPVSTFNSSFMVAMAMREANREAEGAVRENLVKVHKAWSEYRGKYGKDPKTLSELGLTSGENALTDPARTENGYLSYELVAVPEGVEPQEWHLLAYYKPTAFGRLAVTRNGFAHSWNERRFRSTLASMRGAR